MKRLKSQWSEVLISAILSLLFGGCFGVPILELPSSTDLGSSRGYRIVRSILHFHSPYSWDACDKKGVESGTLNAACLSNLKDALCKNKIDFLFLTDHPSNMASYEMKDLLLPGSSDEIVVKNGDPVANRLGSCSNSHIPTIVVGFESKLLAMGMTRHLPGTPAERSALYDEESLAIKSRLINEADAIVAIPHTESRSLQTFRDITPDALEIYNFHAVVDPKIRKQYLGLPPFENFANVLTYFIDPYGSLNPDFISMYFININKVYKFVWNSLIFEGYKITGFGGSDSHQNVFPQRASDGERLDSHRRLTKMMSNHYLVQENSVDAVKGAIKAGRGWLVFEGLGTPAQMDFYATAEDTTFNIGEEVTVVGDKTTIHVIAPRLVASSGYNGTPPILIVRLKRVVEGGKDETVQESIQGDIHLTTNVTGAYRAEINMIPLHLGSVVDDYSLSLVEYPWIVTNHIYLK